MKLSVEEVSNVAVLARLALAEEEKQRLTGHLNEIIEHFSRLQELDTADVEPDGPTASAPVCMVRNL